jgi:hypothetical protein
MSQPDLVGRFIPLGDRDEHRAVARQVAEANRQILDRARAEGAEDFEILSIERVDKAGFRVMARRRSVADQDEREGNARMVERARAGDSEGRRRIDAHNRREAAKLNRSWEAGRLPGIERDVGRGFETHTDWLARRRPSGRAPRLAAADTRTPGSRRQRAPPRDDDDPHLATALALPGPRPDDCEVYCWLNDGGVAGPLSKPQAVRLIGGKLMSAYDRELFGEESE